MSKFRKDINGLRAIAVIAVVFFHFNNSWLPGGFAGVDVFFVISGFLMTGIIFKGIEQEKFSLLNFYISRANRIIPALAVLCFVLLLWGWFYLTPQDYKTLGKHVGNSLIFLSNITYWDEAGYFDAASHEKWLLHTWSLSVEWQFYVIYPLVLIGFSKVFPIKFIKLMVLIGAVFFFILGAIATYKWPTPAYYLLPSRAWEMMIGGAAFLYPINIKDKNKKKLEWVGLCLIIGAYFLITRKTPWPGYLSMIPVIGTFIIIQANRQNSLITGNIVFQKLGLWSYSIYLWHWPIVVSIYYYSLDNSYVYLGIILSLFAGILSHKLIETYKFKGGGGNKIDYLKCKPIYMVLFLSLFCTFIYLEEGIPSRFSLSQQEKVIISQLKMPDRTNGYCFYSYNLPGFKLSEKQGTNCYLGDKTKKTSTLLFGDSFAGHYEPFFDEIFKLNHMSLISVSTNSCAPSLTERFNGSKNNLAYEQCLLNRKFLNKNMHKYKNIIFAGSWERAIEKGQFSDIEDVIIKTAQSGVNVIIMPAPVRFKADILKYFYRTLYYASPFNKSILNESDALMKIGNERLKKISEKFTNVYFIDRKLIFSDSHMFLYNGVSIPYSLDGEHISILGSKYSAKFFMQQKDYKFVMNKIKLSQ